MSWISPDRLFRLVEDEREERFEAQRAARLRAIGERARAGRRRTEPAPVQRPLVAVVRTSPEQIAADVLAAHDLSIRTIVTRSGTYRPIGYCACGWDTGPKRTDEGVRTSWRGHVANVGPRIAR